MKHSTLRAWVALRVASVTPEDRSGRAWTLVANVETLDHTTHRGQFRFFDVRWGPSLTNWDDGPRVSHRIATTRTGTIRILYPYEVDRLPDVEDIACDEADRVVAALQDSAARLAASAEGWHVWTHARHEGAEDYGEGLVVSRITIEILHRRA